MKKWILFILLSSSSLFSADCSPFFLTAKAAYFYPQDSTYRKIYGAGFLPLIEGGAFLYRPFFVSAEGGYFWKDGDVKSFDVTCHTSVEQVPLILFLGYRYEMSCTDFTFKVGPDYIYTKTKVDIPNLQSVEKKSSFGGAVGTAMTFKCSSCLYGELFLDYLYNREKVKNSGTHFFVHLGGIQLGAGIGYRF